MYYTEGSWPGSSPRHEDDNMKAHEGTRDEEDGLAVERRAEAKMSGDWDDWDETELVQGKPRLQ